MEIKLESLKCDKFESFKENEFSTLSKCVGGVATTWVSSQGSGCDSLDLQSGNFDKDYAHNPCD